MTKEQLQVKEFMTKAGQSCPDKPFFPDSNTRILRVKLLLEEVLELAEASGVEIEVVDGGHYGEKSSLRVQDLKFKSTYNVDLVKVADALTDIDYVNLGAACAYGLDLAPFQDEVHRSNITEFIDGYRMDDGKWMKGKSYTPANIGPILDKQLGINYVVAPMETDRKPDLKSSHIDRLPYLNMKIDDFRKAVVKLGYICEFLSEDRPCITLSVGPHDVLVIRTENGIVKNIY